MRPRLYYYYVPPCCATALDPFLANSGPTVACRSLLLLLFWRRPLFVSCVPFRPRFGHPVALRRSSHLSSVLFIGSSWLFPSSARHITYSRFRRLSLLLCLGLVTLPRYPLLFPPFNFVGAPLGAGNCCPLSRHRFFGALFLAFAFIPQLLLLIVPAVPLAWCHSLARAPRCLLHIARRLRGTAAQLPPLLRATLGFLACYPPGLNFDGLGSQPSALVLRFGRSLLRS